MRRWEIEVRTFEVTMNNKLWEIIPENTMDHWLEVKDPEGWYSAIIKLDGCVEFTRYFNAPMFNEDEDDASSIHLCSLDDAIERLQALKQISNEFFKTEEKWGGSNADKEDC